MMKRRTAREKALQALFQIDMNEASPEDAMHNILQGAPVDSYLSELVHGTSKNLKEIDEIMKVLVLFRFRTSDFQIEFPQYEYLLHQQLKLSYSLKLVVYYLGFSRQQSE